MIANDTLTDAQINDEEISIKEIILKFKRSVLYLFSNWKVILSIGFLGGAIGFYYSMVRKPIYTASTTFVLEDDKSGGMGNLAGLASIAGVDLGGNGGGIFQGDNILELYKSRKMVLQTLLTVDDVNGRKELLIDRYVDFNDLKKTWAKKSNHNISFTADTTIDGISILKPNRIRDSILTVIVGDIVKNYLSVTKPDKKLSIIKVDVKASDEVFAKLFNDVLVKNVNDFYVHTKTKKSLQNINILEKKRDSVKAAMNGAIYTSVAASDATPNLNPTKQVQRIVPAQRAQFSAETNKAVFSSLVQNLEMSKLSLLKDTPLLEVIDQPVYPLKMDKVGKLKGIIFGSILATFFTVIVLLCKYAFKNIMK